MPLPRLRPSSGSRFGPKTSRAMMRTIAISGSPMFPGIEPMLPRPVGRSAVALDDAVGDQGQELPLFGVEPGLLQRLLGLGDQDQRPRPDAVEGARGGDA